jgi:hypothetical protein
MNQCYKIHTVLSHIQKCYLFSEVYMFSVKTKMVPCGEPAISHDSHHVSLVQWTNLFASRHKGHRLKLGCSC